MKKNLLLTGLFITFSLAVKSQVGINTSNPQGIFNIDGLKNNPSTGIPTAIQAKDDLVTTSNGNVGLGLTAPGTTLDVNGAITNRETVLTVAGNAVSVPSNVSLVQLTGAATAVVAITSPAAPNAGQRLIVYNNTTGGFGATLDGVTVPNGKALEFIFSNSFWRSTEGGLLGASSVNIYNTNGTLTDNRTVTQGANTLAFTGTQTNAFSVDGNTLSVDAANDRVGVGTTTPTNKLVVAGTNAQPSALGIANTTATFRVDGNTNHALDFGTYANAPFGSYIASQNKTTSISLPLVLNPTGGNVGVGTNAPDNSALLDLSATNRGFLMPRVSLTSTTDGATVPSPASGLMVYNSNTALSPYGDGLYYNSGTSVAPQWSKLSPQTTDYQLLGVFTSVATAPVDQAAIASGVIVNNINLGLSVPITIPANSTAKIAVDYSVPVGTVGSAGTELGYYGIRFLKNGTEAPEGSRKYSIPVGDNGSQMASISGKFSETLTNSSSSPVTITYTLNGYIESSNLPTRFNMWATSGNNFNWGKGSMGVTVFTKDN
ncbi:hypothetical protein [Chryseobacterium sp. NFX27]|uniref:hypothetical protein n=1 Tax=Chryseobacterium sp. NFX27 TaxID=2819618 RepID=UPI003CF07372